MKVHTLSQEENSLGIKEEVDPQDKANNSQSVETIKEKGSREIGVGRSLNGFADTVGCKGTKLQTAPPRNKE
jgi:hypothetical protein